MGVAHELARKYQHDDRLSRRHDVRAARRRRPQFSDRIGDRVRIALRPPRLQLADLPALRAMVRRHDRAIAAGRLRTADSRVIWLEDIADGPVSAAGTLRRNLLIYGGLGVLIPFPAIWVIDKLLVALKLA